MQELQLRNEEVAQFEALKKQSQQIAENCSQLNVTDSTSLAVATQNLSKLKEFIRNLEKLRKETKEPYLKAGQQIDALAKNLSNPLEAVLKSGENNILAYNKAEEEKARKEQKRIQDIKSDINDYSKKAIYAIDLADSEEMLNRVYNKFVKEFPGEERWFEFMEEATQMRIALRDYVKQKHIQLTTPKEADETVQEVIQETITSQLEVFGAEEIKEAEFTTTSNIKEKWVFELSDAAALPIGWRSLNEKAVKEWLKNPDIELTDGLILGGVKFTIEKQLKIR
jgi:hypothetical protein